MEKWITRIIGVGLALAVLAICFNEMATTRNQDGPSRLIQRPWPLETPPPVSNEQEAEEYRPPSPPASLLASK